MDAQCAGILRLTKAPLGNRAFRRTAMSTTIDRRRDYICFFMSERLMKLNS